MALIDNVCAGAKYSGPRWRQQAGVELGKNKVKVTFTQRQIRSSDSSYPRYPLAARPVLDHYTRNRPVRIVLSIAISVNGREVRVHPSIWLGLFDLNRAAVTQLKDGSFLLTMDGADGGAGYDLRVSFNRTLVWRKEEGWNPDLNGYSAVTYYR